MPRRQRRSTGKIANQKILAKSDLFLNEDEDQSAFTGTLEGKVVGCPRGPINNWTITWKNFVTSNDETSNK